MSMDNLQSLLQDRADILARLSQLPYEGTPEIKGQGERRYLYMRKREGGRVTSTYVGPYTQELHETLLLSSRQSRELHKQLRRVTKELAAEGFTGGELTPEVELNRAAARANLAATIYDQAVLEGIGTSFPQTEEIIEGGIVRGIAAADVQKVLNLKHAWEFILDADVLQCPSDFALLSHIARLVNEGFFADGGRIRAVPVRIGGSTYMPSLPIEADVKSTIRELVASTEPIEAAINVALYVMRTQLFNDGNKRAAIIFANHILIARGGGLLAVPETKVPEFKELLVAFYEQGEGSAAHLKICGFMRDEAWMRLPV